jgi:hypothetical protein
MAPEFAAPKSDPGSRTAPGVGLIWIDETDFRQRNY